jgi:hypothetical protein
VTSPYGHFSFSVFKHEHRKNLNLVRSRFPQPANLKHFLLLLLSEIKRELRRIHVYGCRCDERIEATTEGSKRLVYTGLGRDGDTLFVYNEEIE